MLKNITVEFGLIRWQGKYRQRRRASCGKQLSLEGTTANQAAKAAPSHVKKISGN